MLHDFWKYFDQIITKILPLEDLVKILGLGQTLSLSRI